VTVVFGIIIIICRLVIIVVSPFSHYYDEQNVNNSLHL